MLRRVVRHISGKHSWRIPHLDFLANCGQCLPKVYEAQKIAKLGLASALYFAQMVETFVSVAPFSCVLCGAKKVYTATIS